MNWSLVPSVPDLVLASALLVALWLGLHVERSLASRNREWRRHVATLEREWQLRFAQEQQRLTEAMYELEKTLSPRAPAGNINRNKRTEALFMLRRGDSPDAVASVLSIPRNEVDLLIKVQGVVARARRIVAGASTEGSQAGIAPEEGEVRPLAAINLRDSGG